MYANDEPSSWKVVPVAGGPAAAPFADQEQPVHQLEAEQAEQIDLNPEVSEQLDTGLLMSFLTDFRSAEYEQIRKQREEELAKTRKRVPRRPVVPESEEEIPEGYYETGEAGEAGQAAYENPQEQWAAPPPPEPEGQWAPPSPPQVEGHWAPPTAAQPGADQVSGGDFLTAASKPEEPGRRLRLPFGIAGSRNVRQSPATT